MVFVPYGDSGSLNVIHDSSNDSAGSILFSFESSHVRHDTDDSVSAGSIVDLQTLYSNRNYFLQDSDLTDISSQTITAVRASAFPETAASEDTTPTQVWIG
jgi:hypothetical protein